MTRTTPTKTISQKVVENAMLFSQKALKYSIWVFSTEFEFCICILYMWKCVLRTWSRIVCKHACASLYRTRNSSVAARQIHRVAKIRNHVPHEICLNRLLYILIPVNSFMLQANNKLIFSARSLQRNCFVAASLPLKILLCAVHFSIPTELEMARTIHHTRKLEN